MPRKNYPTVPAVHNGRLLYAGYVRKTRDILRKQERRASARNALLDKRQAEAFERKEKTINALKKRIDKIERYPSKLGVALLREISRSSKTPAEIRALASAILLKWSDGDFSYGKRRRQSSGGNQAPGP